MVFLSWFLMLLKALLTLNIMSFKWLFCFFVTWKRSFLRTFVKVWEKTLLAPPSFKDSSQKFWSRGILVQNKPSWFKIRPPHPHSLIIYRALQKFYIYKFWWLSSTIKSFETFFGENKLQRGEETIKSVGNGDILGETKQIGRVAAKLFFPVSLMIICSESKSCSATLPLDK